LGSLLVLPDNAHTAKHCESLATVYRVREVNETFCSRAPEAVSNGVDPVRDPRALRGINEILSNAAKKNVSNGLDGNPPPRYNSSAF
jgi:hypothetical protein